MRRKGAIIHRAGEIASLRFLSPTECDWARRPFDYKSAGGGVYAAEEQMKFASYIDFWP